MATRIYLSGNQFPSRVFPNSFVAPFTSTAIGLAAAGTGRVRSLGTTNHETTETNTTRDNYHLVDFVVFPPLRAQTISGTLKGQIRAFESSASGDFHLVTAVHLWRANLTNGPILWGDAANGTTISAVAGTVNYELDTVATNRKIPAGWSGAGVTLTQQVATAGDCLVISLGARAINTIAAALTPTIVGGSTQQASDLPEDETTTTDLMPWVEFSQDLLFQNTPIVNAVQEAAAPPTTGQTWPRGQQP
jgi:hypothetical protein